ncbi:MAG: TetR/AcrR family transcriptional regulator C-terminal domain-containing protein [Acidimicrobiales bacterium]
MADSNKPPYLRIVEEIRRRISEGLLSPGDRVPSTREITREWGVAMATATKTLATLRQEGVVRAVPGVGTVVASPTPARLALARPAGETAGQANGHGPRVTRDHEEPLSRERIVAAAVLVADREGLAAVSMRRISTQLDASTMSMYRYVRGKDDLLAAMVDAAFAEFPPPSQPPPGWRDQLLLAARLQWDMYRCHPWLAEAVSFTRPQATLSTLPHFEWVLRAVDGLGLDPSTMLYVAVTLFSYVHGTAVNLVAEAEAEQDSGLSYEQFSATQEPVVGQLLATGRFPVFTRVTTDLADRRHPEDVRRGLDLDALFEFGLQQLLAGLADLVEPGQRARQFTSRP